MVLLAQLERDDSQSDRRASDRRTLKLRVPGSIRSETGVAVLVHDLSTSGLLIETTADLAVGFLLDIDLPEAGPRTATVVWNRDRLFGCEFQKPLSKAGLSAALLKSQAGLKAQIDTQDFASALDEPEGEKLPRPARVGIIAGLSAALWLLIIGALAYFI